MLSGVCPCTLPKQCGAHSALTSALPPTLAADIFTYLGITGKNEFGFRASIYSAKLCVHGRRGMCLACSDAVPA